MKIEAERFGTERERQKMRRQISLDEISDGKLYGLQDMVRAGCSDCKGCSACCRDMGNSIILDPLDIYRLTKGLGKTFEELLQDTIELHTVDGIVLPNLKMTEEGKCCPFLNEEGRCSIHALRPGLCRIFPLGRHYDGTSFQYFFQIHECKKEPKTKVKVRKWIDTPEAEKNGQYIADWHYFLKAMQEYAEASGEDDLIRTLNLYLLRQFFMTPYEQEENFYEQFYKRLAGAKQTLQV